MSENKKNKLEAISKSIALVAEKEKLIAFNFKYYCFGDDEGQTFQNWQEDNILIDYNEKLVSISNNRIEKLKKDGILEIFNSYPTDSKFKCPKSLEGANISWARLKITGKRRIIGFIVSVDEKNNIFYFVFLDKNHEFAPSYAKTKKRK